jgi:hypothetical protein
MIKSGLAVSVAFAALLAFQGQAAAQDVDAFLARFQAVMAEQGTNVAWTGVERYDNGDGAPVIALSGVNVDVNGEGTTLDLVELIDVTEEGNGGWRIGTLYVPEYNKRDGDTSIHISEIAIDTISILPEGQELAWGSPVDTGGFSLGELTVRTSEDNYLTVEEAYVAIERPEGTEPYRFSGGFETVTSDMSTAEDPRTRAALAELGLDAISGSLEMDGEWDPADGRISISRYDLTFDDAGTFRIKLELGGYTPEFIKSLRETQAHMMANPGDNSAAGLAMMGLMQQLTFHSAQIRFEDNNLTNKVLDFVAKQQGARSKDIANQAKAMVPFMMMQLGDQQLTTQATTAVSAFLDNPGNLVITAQPATPVPFALLMAGAMSAPQSLPQTLGVGIAANE